MMNRQWFISKKLSKSWKIKKKRLKNSNMRLLQKLKKWKSKSHHSILQDLLKLKNSPINQKNAIDSKKKSSHYKIRLTTSTLSNNMKVIWTKIKRSNTCSDWRKRTTIWRNIWGNSNMSFKSKKTKNYNLNFCKTQQLRLNIRKSRRSWKKRKLNLKELWRTWERCVTISHQELCTQTCLKKKLKINLKSSRRLNV